MNHEAIPEETPERTYVCSECGDPIAKDDEGWYHEDDFEAQP